LAAGGVGVAQPSWVAFSWAILELLGGLGRRFTCGAAASVAVIIKGRGGNFF
jgi:hypothetical protein